MENRDAWPWLVVGFLALVVGVPLAIWLIVEVIKAAIVGIAASFASAQVILATGAAGFSMPVAITLWGAGGISVVVLAVRAGGEVIEKARQRPLPWLVPLLVFLSASTIEVAKELASLDDVLMKVASALIVSVLTVSGGLMATHDGRIVKATGVGMSFLPAVFLLGLAARDGGIQSLMETIQTYPVLFAMCMLLLVGGGAVVALFAYQPKG